jgi:hypothetical protein
MITRILDCPARLFAILVAVLLALALALATGPAAAQEKEAFRTVSGAASVASFAAAPAFACSVPRRGN